MQKYRCTYCEYIYDPVSGDPEHNVGRYTPSTRCPTTGYVPSAAGGNGLSMR